MDKQTTDARGQIKSCTWTGIALSVVGGVIMGFAWPHTSMDVLGSPEDHGSGLVVALGAAITWVGNVIALVGLIGYGVWYGREASPLAENAA